MEPIDYIGICVVVISIILLIKKFFDKDSSGGCGCGNKKCNSK